MDHNSHILLTKIRKHQHTHTKKDPFFPAMINEQQQIQNPNILKSPNYPPLTSSNDVILRQTINDISNLISLSFTVHMFSVKYQLIRDKLEQLNSGLITAQINSATVNPLLGLISEVGITVADCRTIMSKCNLSKYPGKLHMQSDLDMIISRLEAHTTKLSNVCSMYGLISNGVFALVVSKPGAGATREEMRFYVNDLLTRVKIGDGEMKLEALILMNRAIMEDERYLKVVVEMDGLVMLLVCLLESCDGRIVDEVSVTVSEISRFESYRGVLAGFGIVERLIRVVEMSGSLKAKENAIRCLGRLTDGGDNAWAFSSHGGVTTLLGVCLSDNFVLAGIACWVLRNLLVVEEIKRFMIEEGVVETLIVLVKSKDELSQLGAIEFIQTLAFGDECVCHLIVKDGGVRALVRLMDPKSNVSFKLRETALKAIENLCFSSVDYVNLVISYGFMDQLLFFLRKGDVSMQELAFKSASRLSTTSQETQKSMGNVGFMQEFIKFLEGKSYEIREMAAESLACMMTVPKNRKKFSQDDHNIRLVLQLLDPNEGNSGNFKFLLSILLSLSNCNNARKRIAHSGYIKNIENLADAGVSDAKKIVRKLSTNRFRNMFNGILHS